MSRSAHTAGPRGPPAWGRSPWWIASMTEPVVTRNRPSPTGRRSIRTRGPSRAVRPAPFMPPIPRAVWPLAGTPSAADRVAATVQDCASLGRADAGAGPSTTFAWPTRRVTMRLSVWRASAPQKDAAGPKVAAVVDPIFAALGAEPDPHVWVVWGEE